MDVDGATLAFVDILIKGAVGYVLLGTYSGYATEVFIPALGFVIRFGTGGDVEDGFGADCGKGGSIYCWSLYSKRSD